MLHKLEALHEATRAALWDMEELTRASIPDRARLSTVRWKLTSLTTKRLRLIELEIYPALLPAAQPEERAALEQLAADRRERRQMSADHIERWSLERALTDWEGYRKASAAIRSDALAKLNREREVLIPLLQRLEHASPGSSAGAPRR